MSLEPCESGAPTGHSGPTRRVQVEMAEGRRDFALCLAHIDSLSAEGVRALDLDTAAETANGTGRSDTENLLRRSRKALSGIAADKDQSDTMRALARKARQSLNNVIVEMGGDD